MQADDYEAIRALIYRYALLVDSADFAGVGKLLDGIELGSGEQRLQVDAAFVQNLYSSSNRVHADGTLRTKHLCSNLIIEPGSDGNQASCHSYYVVLQATEKLPLQAIVAGRYEDNFKKTDGQWRFTRRIVHVDQVGDVSEHLTAAELQATN